MNIEEVIKLRHSAVNFMEDVIMTEDDFKKIFDLTKLAPSAFNLQFTNYMVIIDKKKKERVKELNNHQHKIQTASAVVIVMGNKKSTEQSEAERIYNPMKMLKMMTDLEYENTLGMIKNYNESLQTNANRIDSELSLHVGLHAMLFMLSAKNHGFDTCPMHIHNVEQIKEEFHIPEHLQPYMMITIGKSVDKTRSRGYRKPVGEFVNFNGYKATVQM